MTSCSNSHFRVMQVFVLFYSYSWSPLILVLKWPLCNDLQNNQGSNDSFGSNSIIHLYLLKVVISYILYNISDEQI